MNRTAALLALFLGVIAAPWLAGIALAQSRPPGGTIHRPPPRQASQEAAPLSGVQLQAESAPAGTPYHTGATLRCYDCHSVHYSEQHQYDGTTGEGVPSLADGPNRKLLRRASALDICLSCHDGLTGVPDVLGPDTNGLAERAAGFFGEPEATNYKGHNLKRDPGGAPGSWELCMRCHFGGSLATAAVTCIDCHNPHGNGRYRNLQWASSPGGEPMITAYIRPGATGLERYERANIGYPAPSAGDSSFREVTNICIDCHHSFFAPSYTGNTSPYHRHPGTNTEWSGSYPINRQGAHTDPSNWVAGTQGGVGFTVPRVPFAVVGALSFNEATLVAETNEVFCLSCHKAHGSDEAFASVWNYGAGNAAGCQQCHNR